MEGLGAQTIFVTIAGSHAHGTARAGSDLDLRGVFVTPLPLRLSLFERSEQYEGPLTDRLREIVLPRLGAHPTAKRLHGGAAECVLYDVAKFIGLCAAANPNALELLFADPEDWLYDTPAWRRLHDDRRMFLTRKVQQTFLGYAMSQLKRIRTHRSWLLHPPAHKPRRANFGLPESSTIGREDQVRIEQAIRDRVRSYGIDDLDMPKHLRTALQERLESFWHDTLGATDEELAAHLRAVATRSLDLPAEVVSALNAERKYRAAMKNWGSYQTWKAQRNPVRAGLERRHGYDTKHAMHLVRLMRMGLEVVRSGELRVRRPDANELSAIRDGALSYEELIEQAEALERQMIEAAAKSELPSGVDPAEVDALAFELMT